MITTILLYLLTIVIIIGCIRIIFKPSDSVFDFFMEILLLDWMVDILGAIFESISNNDDY